jgi:hypothetical protein
MTMPLLLAVQPNPGQLAALQEALREQVRGEMVVSDSIHAALTLIDQRLPDVIFLPPLMPVADEDYLMAYLGALPGAGHVQIIGMPLLECAARVTDLGQRVLARWRYAASGTGWSACDPQEFAADVVAYLSHASALKEDNERRIGHARAATGPDRRGTRRWAPHELPWVSLIRLAGGDYADLVNVSSGGALVQTRTRPGLNVLRRSHSHDHERSCLIFQLESGREVHASGRVVRCCPTSRTAARGAYEVAFCFDDSLGLALPNARALIDIEIRETPAPLMDAAVP